MSSTLTINKFDATYHVSPELKDHGALKHRLDGVLQARLGQICAQYLGKIFDKDESGIFFLKTLEFDFHVDLTLLSDDQLAQHWGNNLTKHILKSLSLSNSEMLRHFPNQLAYRTQFIIDLLGGNAWNIWYYHSFNGLRSLPISTVIKEVFCLEPNEATALLLELDKRRYLDQTFNVTTEYDLKQVYGLVLPHTQDSDYQQVITLVCNVWPKVFPSFTRPISSTKNALRLYLELLQKSESIESLFGLREVLDHLLGFAELVIQSSFSKDMIERLARGDLQLIVQEFRQRGYTNYLESLPFLHRAAKGDAKWLTEVVDTFLAKTNSNSKTANIAEPIIFPFGGIFLLLPTLIDLKPLELFTFLPFKSSSSAFPYFLYLLNLKLLGELRLSEAKADSLLAYIAGLDDLPDEDTLEQFVRSNQNELGQKFKQHFLVELASQDRIRGTCLVAELVPMKDKFIFILRDCHQDIWVHAERVSAKDMEDSLKNVLDSIFAATHVARGYVLLPADFLSLESDLSGTWQPLYFEADPHGERVQQLSVKAATGNSLSIWTDSTVILPETVSSTFSQHLSRAKAAQETLSYFMLKGLAPASTNINFDLALTLVAQAVLKIFARKLMGFSQSSPEYLFQNFLAGNSHVYIEKGRIEVKLPRSPLHTVLHMTGVNDMCYTLPWLNSTEVSLSFQDS